MYNKNLLKPYYSLLVPNGGATGATAPAGNLATQTTPSATTACDGCYVDAEGTTTPLSTSTATGSTTTAAPEVTNNELKNNARNSMSQMYRDDSGGAGGGQWKCRTCPYCNGQRDPSPRHPKPEPFTFWRDVLRSPKHVVAPMVEASELPFRMLCRRHGADLAYTPMFHSRSFMESAEYRKKEFSTCPEDRPLFVQFCGHDADTVLAAAKLVEDDCDAVDLNLGCPQGIARRGFYGAYLMEHWDLIHTILHTLAVELKCPVTAKMRLFDDVPLTLAYAEMLRDTGIHVLAVHGRTREQKGQQTGLADLDRIRMVRDCVGSSIPVIENGNILTFDDVAPNLERTGCQAVMSAEALLWDPRLFSNPERPVLTGRSFHCTKQVRMEAIQTAKEYLACVAAYPVDLGFAKGHLFKILYHSYELFQELRQKLGDFNCADGELGWLIEHVDELEAQEAEFGTEGALEKVSKEAKEAEKQRLQELAVENEESYFIDFAAGLAL